MTGYEPVGRGFESLQPYQSEKIRTCLPLATGSGFLFPCMKQHNPVNRRRYLHDTAAVLLSKRPGFPARGNLLNFSKILSRISPVFRKGKRPSMGAFPPRCAHRRKSGAEHHQGRSPAHFCAGDREALIPGKPQTRPQPLSAVFSPHGKL